MSKDEWNLHCTVCGSDNVGPVHSRFYQVYGDIDVYSVATGKLNDLSEDWRDPPAPVAGEYSIGLSYTCDKCASISEMCALHDNKTGTMRVVFRSILVDPFAVK